MVEKKMDLDEKCVCYGIAWIQCSSALKVGAGVAHKRGIELRVAKF
jgi:hypothetical protein